MVQRRLMMALGVLLAVGLFAAGCGDDDSTGEGSLAPTTGAAGTGTGTTAPATPVKGGSVTFLNFSEVPTLDAGLARGSTGGGQIPLIAIYDLLAEVLPDGKVVPRLATSVETTDAKVWTITLRSGLKFSDGSALDAAAIKAHWDRISDPATASPSAGDIATVASYQVSDPLTFKVTLKSPNGQWPRYLMRGLGMVPSPTAVAARGKDFASKPVGAGAFVVDEYVRDDHINMSRNPSYWDAPKPYVDKVTFRPVTDEQQRFDTLGSGQADIGFYVIWSAQLVKSVKDGLDVRIPPISGGQGNVMNVRKAPLDDLRVRQALYFATDLTSLNDKVNNGGANTVDSLFPKDSPLYSADLKAPTNDLKKAQELIDQYVAEKGPVELNVLGTSATSISNQALQQQWSRLKGVKVTVETVETTAFLQRQSKGEFNIAGSAVAGIDPEPSMSSFLYTGSRTNFGGFSDPKIDAALDAGRLALDTKTRAAAYRDFEAAFWKSVPYILTFRLPYASVVNKNVQAYRLIDDGLPDLAGIWLKK